MFVLPEVVLQNIISVGIKNIQSNTGVLDDVFAQYTSPSLNSMYGVNYLDNVKSWFANTKVPVVQAWSFDPQKIPCISIHLGNETEDESKAAMSDFFGNDEANEIIVSPMTVMLDIGIHANRSKDHVLWLYYAISYIIYAYKERMRQMGLQLTTFNASDYNKDSKYMTENIWTRWIRFKCTVQNYIISDPLISVEDIVTDIDKETNGE